MRTNLMRRKIYKDRSIYINMRNKNKRGNRRYNIMSVVETKLWTEMQRDKKCFGRVIEGIKPGFMSEEEYQATIKNLPTRAVGVEKKKSRYITIEV